MLTWIVCLVVLESIMTRLMLRQNILKEMGVYYFLLLFIVGLGLILPLDKWHDEKFKKLMKLKQTPNQRSDHERA